MPTKPASSCSHASELSEQCLTTVQWTSLDASGTEDPVQNSHLHFQNPQHRKLHNLPIFSSEPLPAHSTASFIQLKSPRKTILTKTLWLYRISRQWIAMVCLLMSSHRFPFRLSRTRWKLFISTNPCLGHLLVLHLSFVLFKSSYIIIIFYCYNNIMTNRWAIIIPRLWYCYDRSKSTVFWWCTGLDILNNNNTNICYMPIFDELNE